MFIRCLGYIRCAVFESRSRDRGRNVGKNKDKGLAREKDKDRGKADMRRTRRRENNMCMDRNKYGKKGEGDDKDMIMAITGHEQK